MEPNDDWVVGPVRGRRDMVTLQTCTMPDFENRLIVCADRAYLDTGGKPAVCDLQKLKAAS